MSVSHQHQNVSLRLAVADAAFAIPRADDLHRRMLGDALAAGRRAADPALTMRAVMTGWQWLAGCPVAARQSLHDELREAVARGQTTARAWLPLAVAETDAVLLRAAVSSYIGAAPRSVEARAQALTDAIEWFRRGLTLDRVAVFEALLGLQEPEVNARLAALRGRLTDAERDRVRRQFATATDAPTLEFLAEWDAASPDPQVQPGD